MLSATADATRGDIEIKMLASLRTREFPSADLGSFPRLPRRISRGDDASPTRLPMLRRCGKLLKETTA
jgi:hypothetical protein